jgi:hypothetical protein
MKKISFSKGDKDPFTGCSVTVPVESIIPERLSFLKTAYPPSNRSISSF